MPVCVCDGDDRLEGIFVRGALIAGLTTSTEHADEPFDPPRAASQQGSGAAVRARRLERG